MKMLQQDTAFTPIALVLETEDEALWFWDIVSQYVSVGGPANEQAYQMAIKVSDWFANEAQLGD